MFGIGLPEMIVILAVALIVVGPEKLPDMAKSLAKGIFELKKTLNQVKDSLAEEDNVISSVHSDLKKTADELRGNLLESENTSWQEHQERPGEAGVQDGDIIDVDDVHAAEPDNSVHGDLEVGGEPDLGTEQAESSKRDTEEKDTTTTPDT